MITMAQFLNSYIGRRVEVYQPSQFMEGILLSAAEGYFIVEVENPSYVQPDTRVTVFEQYLSYIRILAA